MRVARILITTVTLFGLLSSAAASELTEERSHAAHLLEVFFECRSLKGEEAASCLKRQARAAHEFGLAIEFETPDLAVRLFEAAIRADPSYVPAYLSYGRFLLDREGGEGTLTKLGELLTRAPNTKEIERLKGVLQGLGKVP